MAPPAPSLALLRSLAPTTATTSTSSHCLRQFSTTTPTQKTMWMPREKYAKVTGLDKLHRRQRAANIQERLDSQARAKSLTFAPTISTTTTTTHSTSSPLFLPTTTNTTSIPFASPLPYLIKRTASSQLPVYEHAKSGGTRHETVIRKITGDIEVLQQHVREALGLRETYTDGKGRKKEFVRVNPVTRQVVVRGWRGAEVKRWLEMGGF